MFPDDRVSPIPQTATNQSDDDCTASRVLPFALHAHLDILARQIQHNGGTGSITLSFSQGDVCVLNQESVMRMDRYGQLL